MNRLFVAAAVLAFLVGLVHSVLGEILIFRRMRQRGFIPTNGGGVIGERHVRILWASWHVLTVFGWCIAAILLLLSRTSPQAAGSDVLATAIIVAMIVGSVFVFVGTRAKHPGWAGLLGVAILTWLAKAAIAASPSPAVASSSAHVEVRWRAAQVTLAPAFLTTLAEMVERLAQGSLYAQRSTPPDTPRELEIVVSYDPPLALELPLRAPVSAPVRSVILFTTSADENGWPTLFAFTDEGSWYLAKYSGPLVLDLFCAPELERYTSATFRTNCHLAPSRHDRDGSPES